MRRREFAKLVTEAGKADGSIDRAEAGYPLHGLALHRDRVMVSREGAIGFIRYQGLFWDGTWDTREINELAECFTRVDIFD